jgi:hypothetical protein
MSSPLCRTVMRLCGIVGSLVVLGCQALGLSGEPPSTREPASATVVAPQRTTTYRVRDVTGQTVTVTVPAMGAQTIAVSDPAAGTVPATVVAVDTQNSQAQVQTQKGQRLMLALSPELLERMRVGDRFLLQVVPPSAQ